MSIPRDFTLRDYEKGLYLYSKPNYEQGLRKIFTNKALIYDPSAMQRMNVKQLNKWMQDFLKENDDLVRIHIVFERPPSVSDFGLRVKGDDLFRLYTEIGIKENKKIYVDRSKSGLVDFHADFKELRELGVEFDITNTREIDMEVIIDKTSIEAFFFDGMYSMTNLIFPEEF